MDRLQINWSERSVGHALDDRVRLQSGRVRPPALEDTAAIVTARVLLVVLNLNHGDSLVVRLLLLLSVLVI